MVNKNLGSDIILLRFIGCFRSPNRVRRKLTRPSEIGNWRRRQLKKPTEDTRQLELPTTASAPI